MNHYFTNNPNYISNRRKISFRFLTILETFYSDDNVFSKDTLDYGSRVLLETLMKQDINGKVLDLGCGIGYIGIMLKKYKDIDLTMSDINQQASDLALENSRLYKQDNKVLQSDGFANIEDNFDIIVSNPPIRVGKKIMYSLFKESYDHLNEDGRLYLVIRAQQGAASTVKYLQTFQAKVEVIEKKGGYWIIKLLKSVDNIDNN